MGGVVERVVSGGQTGVDRAALDAALALGVACGGWCPRGRRAEDGTIPERYPLQETRSDRYPVRTRRNVRDADATLVLCSGPVSGGTALTLRVAEALEKPRLLIDLDTEARPEVVREWLATTRARILNVAGPRESESPGIHARAKAFLETVLAGA